MWDTCTSHFEPKKFDRDWQGGSGKVKIGQNIAQFAPLEGISGPLKSELGVFWLDFGSFFALFYNVKTQKTRFLKKRPIELADFWYIHTR